MKQEVLNELNQMKYLFGYKAGKVISEQVTPVPNKTNLAPGFKLPGITKDNISKFHDVNEDFLKSLGLFVDVFETQRHKDLTKKAYGTRQAPGPCSRVPNEIPHKDWAACAPILKELKETDTAYEWRNVAASMLIKYLLSASAQEGWTPEVLKNLNDENIKKALSRFANLKVPSVQSEYDNKWYNAGMKNFEEVYDYFEGEIKPALLKAVEMKMQEMGLK